MYRFFWWRSSVCRRCDPLSLSCIRGSGSHTGFCSLAWEQSRSDRLTTTLGPATLVWDRLPMTILFMALLASTIGERVAMPAGRLLLFPLLVLGIASVL